MDNGLISSINPENKDTWENKIFLTFDIDWAHDEVIEDTLDLLSNYKVPGTFFATHDSTIMKRIIDQKFHEIGIHPNFNDLLNDNTCDLTAEYKITELLELFPSAKSMRSHSTTWSSIVQELILKYNLTHESNTFIPWQSSIDLKPWSLWNGLVRVPYFWEDDVAILFNESNTFLKKLYHKGLKVFDFHPIHIFLNTNSLDIYESTRSIHQNPKELIKHRFHGYGTRSRLIDILESFQLS